MMSKNTPSNELYDDLYYESSCGGYEEFYKTQGEILSPWMIYSLEIAKLNSSDRVLDIGTGRGEIAYHSAKTSRLSVGLDYSLSAARFAQILKSKSHQNENPFDLVLADARNLPFQGEHFSVVFMCDIVEHLAQDDLLVVLSRVYHCLQPNGKLIIHTMPNMNYYRFGYPVYRLLSRLVGNNLPKDPRTRFYRGETHINIQTPNSLKLSLKKAGFSNPSISLKQLSGNAFKRFLCQFPLIRHILSNDIIAVGIKDDV